MQGEQGRSSRRGDADEARQYRDAAEAVLEQLDHGIDYLNMIGKLRVAAALRRNHRQIRSQLH